MVATIMIIIAAFSVSGQSGVNVGDRVHRPDSSPTYDDKGTVNEIGTGRNKGCYLVLWDKVKRGDPEHKGHWLCLYGVKNTVFLIDANGNRIRDINEPAIAQPENKEEETTGANTPPTNGNAAKKTTEIEQIPTACSGEPLIDLDTKGRTASAALFGEVIKAQRDVAPSKYTLMTVTTIDSLDVGSPYKWRPGQDLQVIGLPKTVHPVKVTFTVCEDSSLYWNIHTSKNYAYSCYKDDASGQWTCSLTTGKGDSKESWQVKKQAFYDFTGQPRPNP